MDVAVLVSPSAGRGRARSATTAVLGALRGGGLEPRVLPAATRAEAEAEATGAVAAGAGAVVALGGDGVVHAALQAVAGTGTPLAVVPAGTGNDLALALGVPGDPVGAARAAAEDLTDGRTRTVDAGRTGDRWWATVLCCGSDPAVTERASRLRRPRGPRHSDSAVLAELARLRPQEVTLVLDGEQRTVLGSLVVVGNTCWYGAGMRICPGADPADGRLDITVVGPLSRRERVRNRSALRDAAAHLAVSVFRATRIELSCEDVRGYADGEPVAPQPAVTECVPGALTVVGTHRR